MGEIKFVNTLISYTPPARFSKTCQILFQKYKSLLNSASIIRNPVSGILKKPGHPKTTGFSNFSLKDIYTTTSYPKSEIFSLTAFKVSSLPL